ncbi:MAG: CDGSH iron-sulfur domain-containing protein [Planctomycetota bacterium]
MTNVDIQISDHGPIRISGGAFTIKDQSGKPYDLNGRDAIALCRCGASNKKPFCDGGHRAAGFQSQCEGHQLPPPKPKF